MGAKAILVRGSTYSGGHLKERLYRDGLKQRRCELCGQDELWYGRRMSLILDHINGVANDNRLENLRVVCPNCAATLETHCGRKLRLDPRPCERCAQPFQPRYKTHRYCSRACWLRGPRPDRGKPRVSTRRVDRPPYAELMAEIRRTSYEAVGRRFGVSGNAVRKWVLQYQREMSALATREPHAGD